MGGGALPSFSVAIQAITASGGRPGCSRVLSLSVTIIASGGKGVAEFDLVKITILQSCYRTVGNGEH